MYGVERVKDDGVSENPREWWTGKAGYGRSPACTSAEKDAGVWDEPEAAVEAFAGKPASGDEKETAGLLDEEYHARLRIRPATKAMIEAERIRRTKV